VADFQRLRLRQRKHLLIVFDLLELDGKDLRREPIEVRKATLASVYSDFRLAPGKFQKKRENLIFNHQSGDGCGAKNSADVGRAFSST
jgi:ATP-dependent DNA ligase